MISVFPCPFTLGLSGHARKPAFGHKNDLQEYLTGWFRVPTYLEEPEPGVVEELIAELIEI